jgi:hypothetical protein
MHQQRTGIHEQKNDAPKNSCTGVFDVSVPSEEAHWIDQKRGVDLHRNTSEAEQGPGHPENAQHPFDVKP